jgi:hypothetical protein
VRRKRLSKKLSPAKLKRLREKCKAFSQPLTAVEITDFDGRLVAVDYAHGKCWLYPGKTVNGESKDYARKWFRGQWTGAHRIALAIKLGCPLWDLEGYDAAHSSKTVCLGGRCCNPNHLIKKLSNPNRSFDRRKDAQMFGDKITTRSAGETRTLMGTMYPRGLTKDTRKMSFHEGFQENASPELVRFLEMGLSQDMQTMRLSQ